MDKMVRRPYATAPMDVLGLQRRNDDVAITITDEPSDVVVSAEARKMLSEAIDDAIEAVVRIVSQLPERKKSWYKSPQ